MTVISMFGYHLSAKHVDEGAALVEGTGAYTVPVAGYLDYEIIRDVKDPGDMMVNTHWESQGAASAVLDSYRHDDKIARAAALMGKDSLGFMGEVGR